MPKLMVERSWVKTDRMGVFIHWHGRGTKSEDMMRGRKRTEGGVTRCRSSALLESEDGMKTGKPESSQTKTNVDVDAEEQRWPVVMEGDVGERRCGAHMACRSRVWKYTREDKMSARSVLRKKLCRALDECIRMEET